MRNQVFYWKCDCPGSSKSKKSTYFADKHTSESNAIAKKIVIDFLGQTPEQFKCLKIEGNHFAYIFSDKNKKFLLRTDDGSTDDDYMAAESAIMTLLRKKRLPVPELFATNTETTQYPVRYQIMEFIEYPTLLSLSQDNQLNSAKIANDFGSFLAELHNLKFPGFGFIDTKKLKADGRLEGRDDSWQKYFNKCLLKHLDYLEEHKLLSEKNINRIEEIFTQQADFLKIKQGSLLHRDFAFWNILECLNS